jgi:hypothetical protein
MSKTGQLPVFFCWKKPIKSLKPGAAYEKYNMSYYRHMFQHLRNVKTIFWKEQKNIANLKYIIKSRYFVKSPLI